MLMARMIVPGAAAPGELPGEFYSTNVFYLFMLQHQQKVNMLKILWRKKLVQGNI